MKRVDCQLIANDGGWGDRRGGEMLRILPSLMGWEGGGENQVNFNVTQLKSSNCPRDK